MQEMQVYVTYAWWGMEGVKKPEINTEMQNLAMGLKNMLTILQEQFMFQFKGDFSGPVLIVPAPSGGCFKIFLVETEEEMTKISIKVWLSS